MCYVRQKDDQVKKLKTMKTTKKESQYKIAR